MSWVFEHTEEFMELAEIAGRRQFHETKHDRKQFVELNKKDSETVYIAGFISGFTFGYAHGRDCYELYIQEIAKKKTREEVNEAYKKLINNLIEGGS